MKTSALFLALSLALGASAYEVKFPANPKPWEKTAADDLKAYVEKCLGKEDLTAGGVKNPVFHVGDTELAKAKGLSSAQLKDEEWVVKQFGNDVIVNGGGTRGCLYAAYHFLEDVMDVRFWSETEEDVPGPFARKIAALDLRGKPYFFYRDIHRMTRQTSTAQFAVRRRLNRNGSMLIPVELGGGMNFGPPHLCHTFDRYFPKDKYFAAHPEWYALRDGKRLAGPSGQLCLANKELRKIFKEKVLETIRTSEEEAKKKGEVPPVFYAIHPNDNGKYCQCPECTEDIKRCGGSGQLIGFINEIAEEVAVKYPKVFLITFAYAHTTEPPKNGIRAAKNVVIGYASWRANQIATVADETNKQRREEFSAWPAFCDQMTAWDYGVTFQYAEGFPYPSEYYYGDTYLFWTKNKVIGGMWQQDSENMEFIDKRIYIGDYFDIKYYLKTRLFEDPFLDVDALIKDATARYFGPATPYMLKYRERLRDCATRNCGVIRWYSEPLEFSAFIHREDLLAIENLFDAAEKAVAADETHLRRVRKVKRNLDRFVERREKALAKEGDLYVAKPEALIILNKTPGAMTIVDDAEAPDGRAVMIAPDKAKKETLKYFELPLRIELNDKITGKSSVQRDFTPAETPGYQWCDLGVHAYRESEFFFITREWTLQSQIGLSEISGDGNRYRTRALVKFEGPMYRKGSTATNAIYVARIEYIKEKK